MSEEPPPPPPTNPREAIWTQLESHDIEDVLNCKFFLEQQPTREAVLGRDYFIQEATVDPPNPRAYKIVSLTFDLPTEQEALEFNASQLKTDTLFYLRLKRGVASVHPAVQDLFYVLSYKMSRLDGTPVEKQVKDWPSAYEWAKQNIASIAPPK